MYIVETFDLTKDYNGLRAVNKVNLKIKKGEVFGLLGPNGAGKTTLISMLCTILKPTSGTAKVNGFDIIKEKEQVRKSIGIVFQDPSLDDRLTARENLKIHAGLYGVPKNEREKRIDEVLEMVELKERENEIVRKFSGGMKRRLEIARGLIHYPRVLFLDEPTIGLDPQTRKHIWEYIQNLAKRENITILLTTHYMEEADALCDRIAIIDKGEIKALGRPEDLKRRVGEDVILLEVERANNVEKLRNLKNVLNVKVVGNKIYVSAKNGDRLIPKIFEAAKKIGVKIKSINMRKPSLDDVFIHYTGREMVDELNEKEHFRERFRRRI